MSRALIRRIYAHAFEEGWVRAGDHVVDCFGGICGTGLDALWNGLRYTAVELEPKFVALGQQNIDLWQRKYGSKPGFGSARILQGDSRRLVSVIAGADLVCSPPPFVDGSNGDSRPHGGMKTPVPKAGISPPGITDYGAAPGQLARMKEGTAPTLICSSPPYAAIATGAGGLNTKPGADGQQSGRSALSPSQDTDQRYGETAGQLATMREGDAPACIVSSPPFSHPNEQPVASQSRLLKQGYEHFKSPAKMVRGSTDGNLESMPEGRFDAVVSSPPYEGCPVADNPRGIAGAASGGIGTQYRLGNRPKGAQRKADGAYTDSYGVTEGQIGRTEGDTFWQAAREIVAQCHAILRPGGHAIWICKDFVRKGRRVLFSDQWQALCESQGFPLVCRHRAMLVKRHGEQDSIFGGSPEQITTQRKSFFRRLAEKKGSPAIDWEDVICLERAS